MTGSLLRCSDACFGSFRDHVTREHSAPRKACMSAQGVRREKAALSSGCKAHPANRSSRKQPEQSGRQRNGLYELHLYELH